MSISVRDRKLLWGRAGNQCAFPGCGVFLIEDAGGIADPTIVGEEAHIVARRADGPRGDQDPPGGNRDGYGNLILLCATHHTAVDANVAQYPVNVLVEMRRTHEASISAARSAEDAKELTDEVLYAEIVDEWSVRAMLDNWDKWTSGILLCGQPSIKVRHVEALRELAHWLLRRVWPGSKPRLEAAFSNYRTVLMDLLNELHANSLKVGPPGHEDYEVEKFYKQLGALWDPPAYADLERKFLRAVFVVEELGVELTRAANLVADTVRETLSPRYRREEGYVAITSGPTLMDWNKTTTSVCLYPAGTDPATAYAGLDHFQTRAEDRLRQEARS